MRVLTCPPVPINWMAFTADNRQIATAQKPHNHKFRGLTFWDVSSGDDPVAVVPPDSTIDGFALHPASQWAFVNCWSCPDLTAIDLPSGRFHGLRCVAYGRHFPVVASPDGRRIIGSVHTNNYPRPTAKRTDTQDWLVSWVIRPNKPPVIEWERRRTVREPITYLIAFFPSGERMATYESRHWGPRKQHRSQLAVRDATTGDYLHKTDCEGAEQLLVSPDGSFVVGRWGSKLSVWSASDIETKPHVIDGGHDPAWYVADFHGPSIAFHPSGRYLAMTSNDETVKLYDTATWEVARTFTWDIGRMRSIAFSPDGTLAAAGSDKGKIVVWDVDL